MGFCTIQFMVGKDKIIYERKREQYGITKRKDKDLQEDIQHGIVQEKK